MNLLYGKLIEILDEDGLRFGKIAVGGARKKIPLDLLTDAACGDKILICDGVAIGKVAEPPNEKGKYVFGDTGKAP